MRNYFTAILAGALLTACGGGGGTSVATAPVTLKAYSDGSGVIVGYPDLGSGGGPSKLVIGATDLVAAREVAGGTLALTATSQTVNGKYYVVTRTGTASNGAALEVVSEGITLSEDLSEYVAMSAVTIDGELGLLSAGTKPKSLPSGTHSYSGFALIVTETEAGNGTATFTANFDSKTANVAANIPANSASGNNNAYFFSANGMPINTSDGSFSTSSALMGQTGTGGSSASVKGYFAGVGAKGVHGMVYNNSDARTPVGVFVADR